MSKKMIRIPDTFRHELFFSGDQIEYDDRSNEQELAETPFLLDFIHSNQESSWSEKNPSVYIEASFDLWKQGKPDIASAFKQRNRQAACPIMIQEIGRFIQLLFWINGKRVERMTHLGEDLSRCSLLPVNVQDRLSFILDAPDHYHSYIQLSQLYEELEKKWRVRKKLHMDMK